MEFIRRLFMKRSDAQVEVLEWCDPCRAGRCWEVTENPNCQCCKNGHE